MKKIMLNDKYGLTQAVLDGRKTMTRRVIKLTLSDKEYLETAFDYDLREMVILDRYSHYQIGDVVAIAQSYQDCCKENLRPRYEGQIFPPYPIYDNLAGWNNKMFVKAELMPHHIHITNIRIERLQDISNEDCLREGISKAFNGTYDLKVVNGDKKKIMLYDNPREVFAALIDKVSGKGTWNRNPWVFVYEFELID